MTEQKNNTYLEVKDLSKSFGNFEAIKNIGIDIKEGEFVCFLGPSGCGKTTLLRCIAGLETQTSGSVIQKDIDISHEPPSNRDFGIVFQSYALFPNLSVFSTTIIPLVEREANARKEIREAKRLLRDAEALRSSFINQSTQQISHANENEMSSKAVIKAKDAAGGSVADYAERQFSEEAGSHRNVAFGWLIAAIVGAVAVLLTAFYFYFCDAPHLWLEIGEIDWNNLVPKLSILSILVFLKL